MDEDDGESEDRPKTVVWCSPGWGETGRLGHLGVLILFWHRLPVLLWAVIAFLR